MKTIKRAKNEVTLETFRVGEAVTLHTFGHDGRNGTIRNHHHAAVVKDNKVTVDIELPTGEVVRFDKRGEFGALLERGHVEGIVDVVEHDRY